MAMGQLPPWMRKPADARPPAPGNTMRFAPPAQWANMPGTPPSQAAPGPAATPPAQAPSQALSQPGLYLPTIMRTPWQAQAPWQPQPPSVERPPLEQYQPTVLPAPEPVPAWREAAKRGAIRGAVGATIGMFAPQWLSGMITNELVPHDPSIPGWEPHRFTIDELTAVQAGRKPVVVDTFEEAQEVRRAMERGEIETRPILRGIEGDPARMQQVMEHARRTERLSSQLMQTLVPTFMGDSPNLQAMQGAIATAVYVATTPYESQSFSGNMANIYNARANRLLETNPRRSAMNLRLAAAAKEGMEPLFFEYLKQEEKWIHMLAGATVLEKPPTQGEYWLGTTVDPEIDTSLTLLRDVIFDQYGESPESRRAMAFASQQIASGPERAQNIAHRIMLGDDPWQAMEGRYIDLWNPGPEDFEHVAQYIGAVRAWKGDEAAEAALFQVQVTGRIPGEIKPLSEFAALVVTPSPSRLLWGKFARHAMGVLIGKGREVEAARKLYALDDPDILEGVIVGDRIVIPELQGKALMVVQDVPGRPPLLPARSLEVATGAAARAAAQVTKPSAVSRVVQWIEKEPGYWRGVISEEEGVSVYSEAYSAIKAGEVPKDYDRFKDAPFDPDVWKEVKPGTWEPPAGWTPPSEAIITPPPVKPARFVAETKAASNIAERLGFKLTSSARANLMVSQADVLNSVVLQHVKSPEGAKYIFKALANNPGALKFLGGMVDSEGLKRVQPLYKLIEGDMKDPVLFPSLHVKTQQPPLPGEPPMPAFDPIAFRRDLDRALTTAAGELLHVPKPEDVPIIDRVVTAIKGTVSKFYLTTPGYMLRNTVGDHLVMGYEGVDFSFSAQAAIDYLKRVNDPSSRIRGVSVHSGLVDAYGGIDIPIYDYYANFMQNLAFKGEIGGVPTALGEEGRYAITYVDKHRKAMQRIWGKIEADPEVLNALAPEQAQALVASIRGARGVEELLAIPERLQGAQTAGSMVRVSNFLDDPTDLPIELQGRIEARLQNVEDPAELDAALDEIADEIREHVDNMLARVMHPPTLESQELDHLQDMEEARLYAEHLGGQLGLSDEAIGRSADRLDNVMAAGADAQKAGEVALVAAATNHPQPDQARQIILSARSEIVMEQMDARRQSDLIRFQAWEDFQKDPDRAGEIWAKWDEDNTKLHIETQQAVQARLTESADLLERLARGEAVTVPSSKDAINRAAERYREVHDALLAQAQEEIDMGVPIEDFAVELARKRLMVDMAAELPWRALARRPTQFGLDVIHAAQTDVDHYARAAAAIARQNRENIGVAVELVKADAMPRASFRSAYQKAIDNIEAAWKQFFLDASYRYDHASYQIMGGDALPVSDVVHEAATRAGIDLNDMAALSPDELRTFSEHLGRLAYAAEMRAYEPMLTAAREAGHPFPAIKKPLEILDHAVTQLPYNDPTHALRALALELDQFPRGDADAVRAALETGELNPAEAWDTLWRRKELDVPEAPPPTEVTPPLPEVPDVAPPRAMTPTARARGRTIAHDTIKRLQGEGELTSSMADQLRFRAGMGDIQGVFRDFLEAEGLLTPDEIEMMEGFLDKWPAADVEGVPVDEFVGAEVARMTAEPPAPRPPTEVTREVTTRTTARSIANPAMEYEFEHKIVDLDELAASHKWRAGKLELNEDYPQELQARIRDRAASEMQVKQIAQQLQPDLLIRDTGAIDRGSPIVGPDNIVESGNGRTLAIYRARGANPEQWAEYQAYLRENAAELGLGPEDFEGVESPVLVRERVTDVDRVEFAQEANQPITMMMSALENAVSDSKKISPERMAHLEMGATTSIEDALRAQQNKSFVEHFLDKLPKTEQAALVDPHGNLNAQGMERLKWAMFHRVYSGEAGTRLSQAFLESADPTMLMVRQAMLDSLPQMAQAEGLIDAGRRADDLRLGEDIASAVDQYRRVKADPSLTVSQYLSQPKLFGDPDLTPVQNEILRFIHEQGLRSKAPFRDLLRGYAGWVQNLPEKAQMAMPGLEAPRKTKVEVLSGLAGELQPEAEGLFAGLEATITPGGPAPSPELAPEAAEVVAREAAPVPGVARTGGVAGEELENFVRQAAAAGATPEGLAQSLPLTKAQVEAILGPVEEAVEEAAAGIEVGDMVMPIDAEGTLLSAPIKVTDVTEKGGVRWYAVEGTKTRYPEGRLLLAETPEAEARTLRSWQSVADQRARLLDEVQPTIQDPTPAALSGEQAAQIARTNAMMGNAEHPNLSRGASVIGDQQIRELDKLRGRLRGSWGDLKSAAGEGIPPGQMERIRQMIKDLVPAHNESLAAAGEAARLQADDILLDYTRRYDFDTWLSRLFPYHFWYTRSAKNWALRFMSDPGHLLSFVRYNEANKKHNEEKGYRQRFEGSWDIPAPWLPDWMGDSIMFRPENFLWPYESLAYTDWYDIGESQNVLDLMYRFTRNVGMRPYFFWEVPLQMGGLIGEGGRSIGTQTAQARAIQGITGMMREAGVQQIPPGGIQPEMPLRRAIGIPEQELWDPYRVVRMLDNMVKTGDLPKEHALMAAELQARVQEGDYEISEAMGLPGGVFSKKEPGVRVTPAVRRTAEALGWTDEELKVAQTALAGAVQRAGVETGIRGLGTFLGLPARIYPEGERQAVEMQAQERGQVYSPLTGLGGRGAIERFREQFPETVATWMKSFFIPGLDTEYQSWRPQEIYALTTYRAAAESVEASYNEQISESIRERPWDTVAVRDLRRQMSEEKAALRLKHFGPDDQSKVYLSSTYGATPTEAAQIRRDDLLSAVSMTMPHLEDFVGPDGLADYDAYEAERDRFLGSLVGEMAVHPLVVAMKKELADRGQIPPEFVTELLSGITEEDLHQHWRRNDTPLEAAQRVWMETQYRRAWDLYRTHVDKGFSAGQAYEWVQDYFDSVRATDLIPDVMKEYGRKWDEKELREAYQGVTFPPVTDAQRLRLPPERREYSEAGDAFWDFYYNELPPGRLGTGGKEHPVVKLVLDRETRGTATTEQYQMAVEVMQNWKAQNYDPEAWGTPSDWARARELHEEFKALASERWPHINELLDEYFSLGMLERRELRRQHKEIDLYYEYREWFGHKHPLYGYFYVGQDLDDLGSVPPAGGNGKAPGVAKPYYQGGAQIRTWDDFLTVADPAAIQELFSMMRGEDQGTPTLAKVHAEHGWGTISQWAQHLIQLYQQQ